MRCPKCKADKPHKAKFCDECGGPLGPGVDKTIGLESGEELEVKSEGLCVIPIFHKSQALLEMICRIGPCLAKTMDLDHFLEVVTEEFVSRMELEAIGILLYDDNLNDFYWREIRDPKCFLREDASERLGKVDRIAIDRAFQTAEPVMVRYPDAGSPSRNYSDANGEPLICSELVVPLNTRDKTVGLLVLINTESTGFTKEDIGVSLAMAGILAMSIENADFFEELLNSYRKVLGLERIKSKIIHRLSNELKTPLAILKGSLKNLELRLTALGIRDFDSAFVRMNRQVENLEHLEMQVHSIMKTGGSEEREMLSRLLESAASLIELQAEQKPEIRPEAALILRILEEAFPAQNEQWRSIDIKEFTESVIEKVRGHMVQRGRRLTLSFDITQKAELLIPDLVLHSTIEGLIRNAVEATLDYGFVGVRGRINGDFYELIVEDCGIGIPTDDWGLVFDGFYQVQEIDDYTSGRPYSFNAGGKGMDLFRIKMFSKIYGFGLYFQSRRCRHLIESLRECPGSVDRCPYCKSFQDCLDTGGTIFEVDLPLSGRHVGNSVIS
jgi:signal transduction histidine kinase